ncbi:E3 ubiquitin-protein ligase HAKAI homolog [Apium graveolens]|uniref:E3 ubiquitin-protein ligase HAKAI homolog n=1 Tax=Apium graveolens TaxID=4045 RepID=UPI003D790759
MLQIKLRSKGGTSTEGGVGVKPTAGEAVTVACPDHLTIADLAVAKSLGSVTASPVVKIVGRKSRRQMGERVHICVRCDFPIAIYGRLSPCDHAFCLDCARNDSVCSLCEERIQKIQTIKMGEGILICAAPQCFKSFLKKDEFESHVRRNHGDLLSPETMKEEGYESEAASARKPATSESTVQAPPKSVLSPSASSHQLHDPEDRSRNHQPRDQYACIQPKLEPPFSGPTPNLVADAVADNSNPQGFDRADARNLQGRHQQESGQFQDSQLVPNDNSFPGYAMQFHQHPTNAMPVNPSLVQNPSQFIYPQFGQDGNPYYGSHFQPRQDSAPEGERPGSVSGYPPRPAGGPVNFSGSYPQPWGVGPAGGFFDPSLVGRGNMDAFKTLSMSDSHGRVAVFQGSFEQNQTPNLVFHPAANQDGEQLSGQNAIEARDGMCMLASQSLPPPPASHPPHSSHRNRSHFFHGGTSHDAQAPGWQPEQRDSFGGAQE